MATSQSYPGQGQPVPRQPCTHAHRQVLHNLVQGPDRGPPSLLPTARPGTSLSDSPMAARVVQANCVVWGMSCHFRGGIACLQQRGAVRGSSLPRKLWDCSRNSFSPLRSAPRALVLAHLPAPRGIGLSSRPIAKQTDSLLVLLLTDLLCNLHREPYLPLSLLLLDLPPSI